MSNLEIQEIAHEIASGIDDASISERVRDIFSLEHA
jgi:hypothetical protein